MNDDVEAREIARVLTEAQRKAIHQAEAARATLLAAGVNIPAVLPDTPLTTDHLVDFFALVVKAKLRRSEEKYGWGDAWRDPKGLDGLRDSLFHHVLKGDPIDIGGLSAMLWFHDASTTPTGDVIAALRAENARLRGVIEQVIEQCEDIDAVVTCMSCGEDEPLADCAFMDVLKNALKDPPA